MLLEESLLNDILTKYTGRKRDALLPILWDVQTAYGHISQEAVRAISHTIRVPEAEIFGVIGFYSMFHAEPTGRKIVRVCTSPVCHACDSHKTLDALTAQLNVSEGETTTDGEYTIERTECLGLCDHAPAVLISEQQQGETLLGDVTADAVPALLDESHPTIYTTHHQSQMSMLFDSATDYHIVQHMLNTMQPADVIQQVEVSGLIGRGGAAFPTGLKWRMVHQSTETTKYIVCNADESEPGTFKDRYLMEQHPEQLLEGMIIAGYAVGANKGYIFIRGEYPQSTQKLQQTMDAAYANGILGQHILGSDFNFDVEIRRGAGAYICGEETALFEAIEGKRGLPRIKPPYPTVSGLFGKPTVVNNVETLSAIPHIVQQGGSWFKAIGTEKSTGTKLVSVSGNVQQAGVYEIVPGMSLRELLNEWCGGVDGNLQAILMGGAAGTFLTPDEIDVPLTFEDLRNIGSTFGSGAIMVFNTDVDLKHILQSIGHFFKHESCGKCFPCQLGSQRQYELLNQLGQGTTDVIALQDIGITMTESSICGLGQTASSAVLSAMDKFPHLFE